MKIFFSAVKKNELLEWLIKEGATNFLFSFEDKKVFNQIKFLNEIKDVPLTILIDSGAFSAWNRGAKIHIEEYINFISKVKEISFHKTYFINLDVIPHKKGTKPTPQQIDTAAKKGIENFFYIKSKGHNTIHTFHQFESMELLKYIVKECNPENYIGISPANDQSLESRNAWLKKVFSIIKDDVRTHCLGLTAKDSLETYPVYSADSSSWLNVTKYGELFNHRQLLKINKKSTEPSNLLYYDDIGTCYNAFRYYINLEKYTTKLWNQRNVLFQS